MVLRIKSEDPTVGPGELSINPMRKKDLSAIHEIEKLVYPKPWSVGVFLSELAHHKERSYSVAVLGGAVVGYSGVMYVLEDAHITNIAVHPDFHRHHIGSALMYSLVLEALDYGAKNLTLEVRVTNLAAQRMYASFGFMPVGVRKGYYQENNEDAIIMWVYEVDTPEYRDRLVQLASKRNLSARRRHFRWFK
ncbi:ribosomal protein S18-alanine N-acetyltransferase [Acidithrix sp. C25]|uniref:ribosomal protein S18-alanine N-acetyltransferase n=1 Tax=Acidithrix sp. C25 TaxID=1671482 RepID=UPI00191BA362|nr:ribosomal protein S18-alanine N-acetyltransferase [Acidithrix sp. C25]CAG4932525.1 unnamed protein product [Acidithrix sp. C25]